jgi:hypothetical protein
MHIVGKESCEKCKFWTWAKNQGNKGVCRRFPPIPMMVGANDQGPIIGSQFPIMMGEGWCGEYAVKLEG